MGSEGVKTLEKHSPAQSMLLQSVYRVLEGSVGNGEAQFNMQHVMACILPLVQLASPRTSLRGNLSI